MAKINVYFNGKNYSIDEGALADARVALESAFETLASSGTLAAGLYVDGVMTKSCDELISDGIIRINGGRVSTNLEETPDGNSNGSSPLLVGYLVLPNDNTITMITSFGYCKNLTGIEIPNSVTQILSEAFRNCTSLTEIVFNGTTAQWSAINKGSLLNYLSPVTHVRCIDGDVAL